MIIFVAFIILLMLFPSKLHLKGINPSYLSKENCNGIKGIFILLIFISHFSIIYGQPYTHALDTSYWWIRTALDQCVVVCYLFYSGYGVMASVSTKGVEYIKAFPQKRILQTLFIYDCSQVLFLVFWIWRGYKYSIKQFVESFLAWESFGNDNWYIFVIIGLYVISYFALRNGKANRAGATKIAIGTVIFMLFLICAKKGSYWYNTMLCYPLGVWYYIYREKIETILRKNKFYFLVLLLMAIFYTVAHKFWKQNLAIYVLTTWLFVSIVLLVTMKYELKNRFLVYCGAHLQGLFLLHRLPMRIFKELSICTNNRYVWIILSVIITFLLEFLFHQVIVCATNRER